MCGVIMINDLIISCRTTCGCGGKLIPYTKQTETTHYLLTCKAYSNNYDHPLLIAIDKNSPVFTKANYRDVMIEYPWFKEIIKKGSDWYNNTKEKAEKWDNAKYHCQSNYEIAVRYQNDLTREDYDKFTSLATILTWIANEIYEDDKLEQEIKQLKEESQRLAIALTGANQILASNLDENHNLKQKQNEAIKLCNEDQSDYATNKFALKIKKILDEKE